MNGTMLDVARIRLTFCSPLGCTAREADSLPYSGMAICFTAGTIPKSGYRFYKLVVKLEFGELDKRETEPRGGTKGSLCEGAGREAD